MADMSRFQRLKNMDNYSMGQSPMLSYVATLWLKTDATFMLHFEHSSLRGLRAESFELAINSTQI